ncbi:MAG: PIG-L family deacetylase [Chloroflexi bacterium]|nr:PIG-L family deacetylase [Chloroflexota bacterium]
MKPYDVPAGNGRTMVVVVAHADDATISCGGFLVQLTARGWRVVLVRVTNDALDSVDLSREDTIKINTADLHQAARILGVADIIDFGYETDRLGDILEVPLRERIIRVYREQRPFSVLTWDPYGMFHEDNQDHIKVAHAVDEAFWTAMFDKHHPEHFSDGLRPHGVYERWYFARQLVEVTTVIDIATVLETKITAVTAHGAMMRNYVHQLRLQAATGGHVLAMLEAARSRELRPLIARLIRQQAATVGSRHGIALAEEYRVTSFDSLAKMLDADGEPVPV